MALTVSPASSTSSFSSVSLATGNHLRQQSSPEPVSNSLLESVAWPEEDYYSSGRLFEEPPRSVQLSPRFFVLAQPVFVVGVPYGLVLTFASWLAPAAIPETIPLGLLAKYLGTNFNLLMASIALIAAALHVSEAFYSLELSAKYGFTETTRRRWFLNTLFFGIFGFWPLVFPDRFQTTKTWYCETTVCVD